MLSTISKSINKLLLFNVILLVFMFLIQRAEIARLKGELSGISGEFKTCEDTLVRQNEAVKANATARDKSAYKETDKAILNSMASYKQPSINQSDTAKLEAVRLQQQEFFKCQE